MRNAMVLSSLVLLLEFRALAVDSPPGAESIPNFSARTNPAIEPVDLLPGPHLFVDDYLIAASANLTKTTHHPERYEGNPILGREQGTTQPYVSVVRDPDTNLFRMWYNRGKGEECALAYAESDDGIHWRTPSLGILGNDNRLLLVGYGAAVIDEGPTFPEKSRRFKLAYWDRVKRGMNVAFSPDGLHWTLWEANPVLADFSEEQFLQDPRRPYGVGDVIDVYWDSFRKRYGAFVKTPAVQSDGYSMAPRAKNYIRRLVSAIYSDDFVHWTQPQRVIVPEPRDPGQLEFYAAGGTIIRGQLLLGFVRMLHDDYACEPGGPTDGIGYTTLVTSRDGTHFDRHDDIFFDRSPIPAAWDRAMTWIGSSLLLGDEVFFYYGGYKRGHKVEPTTERQLGLARMPRDRYVSRDAGKDKIARLVTVPFKSDSLLGKYLVLNTNAREGKVRVRLLDERGNPIEGADFKDSQVVVGDGLALPVTGLDLSKAGAHPFKIEFELDAAELFGFDVCSK